VANLDDLYRDIILDHYRSPRNRGQLPVPPAIRAEGFNPLCGDETIIYVTMHDGVLADIKIESVGCSISQASGSLMGAAVKGRSLEDVRTIIVSFRELMTTTTPPTLAAMRALGELSALQGVAKFPVRIKCAALAWDTLERALDSLRAPPSTSDSIES
jgi:nitrogen fixation NifU-like protein